MLRVMANPAELLAAQLRVWEGSADRSAYQCRGALDNQGADAHVRACQHLSAISDLIDEMDSRGVNTEPIRRNWARWVRLVINPDRNWGQSNSASMDQEALTSLENLAITLELVCPKISEDQREGVLDYLNAIDVALKADDTIPREMKQHLRRVLEHVRRCVRDYDIVGDFDLKAACDRLEADVIRVVKYSRAKHFWWFVTANVAIPAAVNVAVTPAGSELSRLIGR